MAPVKAAAADCLGADERVRHARIFVFTADRNRRRSPTSAWWLWITRIHSHGAEIAAVAGSRQLQLGNQICRFQVVWEIGKPVRIGYIHAKLVITSAM